jgi:hypothetical protein
LIFVIDRRFPQGGIMAPSLWARVAIGLFVIALVSIGEAGAVPHVYQLTSGALTGTFTADLPANQPLISWNITAPTGFGTTVFSGPGSLWDWDDHGTHLNLHSALGGSPPLYFHFNFNANNLRNFLTDSVSGHYDFQHFTNHVEITGSGNWARVPEPNTLWSLVLGLLALVGVQWLSLRSS